jgi:hypothetical protein
VTPLKIITLLVLCISILTSACTSEDMYNFNVKMNPNRYFDVDGFKITLPQFEGRRGIYCRNYMENSAGINIIEWWEDSGDTMWNPIKHTGLCSLYPPYTIERVKISSLPK